MLLLTVVLDDDEYSMICLVLYSNTCTGGDTLEGNIIVGCPVPRYAFDTCTTYQVGLASKISIRVCFLCMISYMRVRFFCFIIQK